MIVRTSAKSRLTIPGTVIRSVIPWTPWRRMSSAILNASESGVRFSTTCSSRSFSITISVSTFSASSADPLLGLLRAAPALEAERPRDDADGERLELACELGDDRGAAGAGAAAFPGGDEDHVGALQRLLQLVAALHRGGVADGRVGAGAETARRLRADVDLHVGVAHQERLRVGVDRDELDPGQAGVDHAVDRVRAAAADADDLDHGQIVSGTVSHLTTYRQKVWTKAASTSSFSAGWGCRERPPCAEYGQSDSLVNAENETLESG